MLAAPPAYCLHLSQGKATVNVSAQAKAVAVAVAQAIASAVAKACTPPNIGLRCHECFTATSVYSVRHTSSAFCSPCQGAVPFLPVLVPDASITGRCVCYWRASSALVQASNKNQAAIAAANASALAVSVEKVSVFTIANTSWPLGPKVLPQHDSMQARADLQLHMISEGHNSLSIAEVGNHKFRYCTGMMVKLRIFGIC